MNFRAASLTHRGPRPENEDCVGFWQTPFGFAVAVADGLGGMGGGSRASEIAISEFAEFARALKSLPPNLMQIGTSIHAAILAAQQENPAFANMATTLSAALLSDGHLLGVHCGDSRISIARRDGIKRLTRDHTEGQRLFEEGLISKGDLIDYPRKNILENALGVHDKIILDTFEFNLEAGDKIFFSTDGLHNAIPLRRLWQLARNITDPDVLIATVERAVAEESADDNYSLVVVLVT